MLIIRRRIYDTKDNWEKVASRLDWKVEKVGTLTNPLLGGSTVATGKPWVGKIEWATKTFELTQTAPFFSPKGLLEGKFFGLFINGQLLDEGVKQSKMEIDFILGWQSLLTFALIYLFPIILTVQFVTQNNWEELKELSVWWLTFTIPGTLMLRYQLNRTDREIKDVLGVH